MKKQKLNEHTAEESDYDLNLYKDIEMDLNREHVSKKKVNKNSRNKTNRLIKKKLKQLVRTPV